MSAVAPSLDRADAKPSSLAISFCTTCHNRTYQLRQVFDANAEQIARTPDTQWIILNYSSCDDLDELMRLRLPYVSSRVIYARDAEIRDWHLSVAKNLAHQLGSGRLLMNLDCDNVIGNAIDLLRSADAAGHRLVHHWSGVFRDGTCGRVAIARSLFHYLGGYDESFWPMGYQDRDLLLRAQALGVTYHHVACDSGLAIRNDKTESVRYCADNGFAWEDYDRMNRERSGRNLSMRSLVANQPKGWTLGRFHIVHGGCHRALSSL